MDFRQRLEQSRIRPVTSEVTDEPEGHFASSYFAVDRVGNPVCLDLRLKGGARKAVPYAFISEINFEIDAGIEILIQGKRINIVGRNLAKLFDHLIAYRVRYIQANIGSDPNEDGLFVKEIMFEEID